MSEHPMLQSKLDLLRKAVEEVVPLLRDLPYNDMIELGRSKAFSKSAGAVHEAWNLVDKIQTAWTHQIREGPFETGTQRKREWLSACRRLTDAASVLDFLQPLSKEETELFLSQHDHVIAARFVSKLIECDTLHLGYL